MGKKSAKGGFFDYFFTVTRVGFGNCTDSFEEDEAVLCFSRHDIRSCAAGKSLNWSIGQETTSMSCAGNFWGIEG